MNTATVHLADVASRIELLSAWIDAQMAYAGQPGLSIGIICDQELVWAKGYGYANVEQSVPATLSTIYRIASITKLFTSTAILQLRDAGRLQLDDPISKHLPWFNIRNRHPDAPPITIRHLLTHTSGLPREASFPYWTDSNVPVREQIRERLAQQETVLPAESEWKYSNLALSLAGEIVTAVSGQEYADFVRQQILDPLDMCSTTVLSPDPQHTNLATGYGRRLPDGHRTLSPFTDCQGITPAANMATTVEDLARFSMLQFRDGMAGGSQVLSGWTLREMQRVHWLDPDWKAGWGLGFRVMRQQDKTYVGHGGSVQGYRTQLQICPADKIAVVVLTNADDGNPTLYVDKAFEWVAPALQKAPGADSRNPVPHPAWSRYVGRYRDVWGDSQVLILDGDLVLINPTLPDPMPGLIKLSPVAEHVFRVQTKEGYSSQGELVVFEIDEVGKTVRMKMGENYSYPVAAW
jgi:D-alanyl-D-alanine carboxypeptidase